MFLIGQVVFPGSFLLMLLLLLTLLLLMMADNFYGQALKRPVELPPVLNDHHHLLVLIGQYMRDGLEALSIKAYVQDEVTACCPDAEHTSSSLP